MQHFDQIIVGGGVIGSAIAYQLSKRGYQVLLLEEKQIGAEASSAAAGMLGVQVEFTENSPLFQFAKESRLLFPELADELKAISGVDIQLKQKGAYKLVYHQKEQEKLREIAHFHNKEGVEAMIVSPEDVMAREPNVSPAFLEALYCPGEGQVSAPHLTKAFALAAKRSGATLLEKSKAEELIIENHQVAGVKTGNKHYYADQVVITAGYKSSAFSAYLPMARHIRPVKGECLSVKTDKPLMEATIFSEDCYIVPKKSGRIIIGAVSTADQTDKQVKAGSLQQLLDRSATIIPALKEAAIEKVWAGIRPSIQDDNPYLGAAAEIDGLYTATGHYRNGILLAPGTAVFMADLIEGKQIPHVFLEAFSPNRNQQIVV